MKFKLKSLGNFKRKYKLAIKEKNQIRDDSCVKLYKSDKIRIRQRKCIEMYKKRADHLTLDLSKTLCEICKRSKNKSD